MHSKEVRNQQKEDDDPMTNDKSILCRVVSGTFLGQKGVRADIFFASATVRKRKIPDLWLGAYLSRVDCMDTYQLLYAGCGSIGKEPIGERLFEQQAPQGDCDRLTRWRQKSII